MKIFALRLNPNDDLKVCLKDFVEQNSIEAGFILTAVGSLKQGTLRFASQNYAQSFKRSFEMVSLVGTLSIHGIHLHIALSDKKGKTIGGHLLEGCIIYTTAEIVIGSSEDFVFLRTEDEKTGYKELEICAKTPQYPLSSKP
ncbi:MULTISPECIES: PPC domain-containing DNA-binding protein [unclassified Coleofasciculus]|uniref:PPC domain-containing DNA-binding protein n=1 Tax=unclassified Coleofasciculus TaxID=2692782 RepID=UPI00187FC463|nr:MULTISPECIES: PPC domain-containing DNA-binding protein [unclassified Coleofasciculus]MBE9128256.1 DNA-binding protein [Coleofasciculus sp. LEGE 07081]MBE9151308.1 DNA-binding protein [Coleofasciculus sp. LEGE 07092]